MLEKWKKSVNNGKAFGALLTDLLKAFYSIDKKVHPLARVTPYLNISERRIIINIFSFQNSVTALLFGCVTVVPTTRTLPLERIII